jgi:hypothetical protein
VSQIPNLEDIAKPPLTIDLPSVEKTVKMVYGLEMDIRRLLPDPQSAMQLIMNDPYTQDYIIRRCLTDSKKMVLQQDELISFDDVNIDSEDAEKLLAWVTEHTLYFFVKRATGMANLAAKFGMGQSKPSTPGSVDSPSPMPSVGPSDASKAS